MLHARLTKKSKKSNRKPRPKSLRLSGLTDVCGKVSVYGEPQLNDLSFGDYIEDICARMMRGEKDFDTLLPCDYKNSKSSGSEQAVA